MLTFFKIKNVFHFKIPYVRGFPFNVKFIKIFFIFKKF